jgi:hypothetical protein
MQQYAMKKVGDLHRASLHHRVTVCISFIDAHEQKSISSVSGAYATKGM